jgi:precorrin-4/cobalt-precorrin-4 C11-methyltransferase
MPHPLHAELTLDEIILACAHAHHEGMDVARLHSGDLSMWSAMGEQLRRLDKLGIPYDITPGVPAFAAAAAALGREITQTDVAQTLILTRVAQRSTPMPPGEELATIAQSRATLALHLSVGNLERVVAELTPIYGDETPVIIVARASWPDESIVHGTLATIVSQVSTSEIPRNALIFIGSALQDFSDRKRSLR